MYLHDKRVLLILFGQYILFAFFCSASSINAEWIYEYHDDFDTNKAEVDSYDHSIFWPESAFPPPEPYLSYSTIYGKPPRSLLFTGYNGTSAHLNYCFPIPLATSAKVSGTLSVDVLYPFNDCADARLSYSLSPDGHTWTFPTVLSEGLNEIAISSMQGTCYVSFLGNRALIDNLHVSLSSPSADIHVPGDYSNIQAAINAALPGQVIEVAAGVYEGEGNRDIDFLGKAITVRSIEGPEVTIINCGTSPDSLTGHRGFYFHQGEGHDSVLKGFTIQAGYIPGSEIPPTDVSWEESAEYPIGGGIYCEFSSPTIINCVVKECGTELGGGIGCIGSEATIVNCSIENCTAGGFGAADSGGLGGGIGLIRNSNVRIIESVIYGNSGYNNSKGAGIYCHNSKAKIVRCQIHDNNAPGNLSGGGLYCAGSSEVILTNCIIHHNNANVGAGVMTQSTLEPPLCRLDIVNCTIAHNTLKLYMPPSPGCGVHSIGNDTTIKNSIIYYNEELDVLLIDAPCESPVIYSDVEGGYMGQGNIDEAPLFAATSIPSESDYHLQSLYGRYNTSSGQWIIDPNHSPCIDAGDPTDPIGTEPLPNGGRINMGAYGGTEQASKSPSCRIYHVDGVNGDDLNNGLSRETAFATIQHGVDEAKDKDIIFVWPDVYVEDVNFNGKAVTIQSAEDAAVVEAQENYAFSFHIAEGPGSVLKNIIIRNSKYGIFCNSASPTIRNLTIVDNDFGISAYSGSEPDIANCIFYNNTDGDLFQCRARFSRLDDPVVEPDSGNINDEPLFADFPNGDYHLVSKRGRFVKSGISEPDLTSGYWILDRISSPCIDAADPAVNPFGELMPNGARLNMGAYGGTAYASMSPWPLRSDANRDGKINLVDLSILAESWLYAMPWVE